MINLSIESQGVFEIITKDELSLLIDKTSKPHRSIIEKDGLGNEFLGWVDLPESIDKAIIEDIKTNAKRLGEVSEVFVVIGIGGSYLGARAVINALEHSFNSLLKGRNKPLILYAGQNLSEDYLSDLLEILDQKDYSLAIISKSGTTLEPALSFRIIKSHLENKYGKDGARERIIAITDREKGALRRLSNKEDYISFPIEDNIGGRFSVLSPVGLLPIAVAGLDINKLMEGARNMREYIISNPNFENNPAWKYCVLRNALREKGKNIEIMVNYNPNLYYISEWWKQLFGESEGKEGKGIYPSNLINTTDLHSMGQYIQEGERIIFETLIHIEKNKKRVSIPKEEDNEDGLNYLIGRNINQINHIAEQGTTMAHLDGGVANIKINLPEINEYNLGELIYFFEYSCALSAYVLGVNPFDQPGVEFYKRNMFKLLGK